MKRIFFAARGALVLTAMVLTAGCLNSESDYQELTEQVAEYRAELATAQQQHEILVAALANITEEKERLSTALAAYEPAPAAGEAPEGRPVALAGDTDTLNPPAAAGPAPGNRVHVAQPGDTLSIIAARYDTDVNTLMALNPYLARRNNYMVWESDKIQLP